MEKNGDSRMVIPIVRYFPTVVLADGEFPVSDVPMECLRRAERVVCCDGAAEKLLAFGREPDFIVGDCDSISDMLQRQYSSIIRKIAEQETNDLTKAVNFCFDNGWNSITVIGATGKREDHTLGNLSLTTDYASKGTVQLLTGYGVFNPQTERVAVYESCAGQQVSIFCLDPKMRITASGLVYPIRDMALSSWWQGTLNESTGNSFTVETDGGKLLVFRQYR
jgi:thiamine pyrophosphokinase